MNQNKISPAIILKMMSKMKFMSIMIPFGIPLQFKAILMPMSVKTPIRFNC